MRKIYIYTVFIFLYTVNLFAQTVSGPQVSYFPPSPNATSLLKDINIPVDLYTGTANISVPIYTISQGGVSIPISLSYNSSGIKVSEISSWVGLGWNLNAGGMITRVVRGLPDEDDNGFSGANKIGNKILTNPTVDYLNNVNAGLWDAEPDLFYFQFPGKSGRFCLNNEKVPVLTPFQNLTIIPPTESKNYWMIIDVDGTTYKFGIDQSSCEVSESKIANQKDDRIKKYTSTWYLSEIIYKIPSSTVKYTYVQGSPIEYVDYVNLKLNRLSCFDGFGTYCEDNPSEELLNVNNIVKINAPKYLYQIVTPKETVTFNSSSGRLDLINGRYLNDISISSKFDSYAKKITLKYAYFSSNRLKLTQVAECSNGLELSPYQFLYNERVNLPSLNSFETDNWGYYNGNGSVDGIPSQNICYDAKYLGRSSIESIKSSFALSGCSKDPSFEYAAANILEHVILPTGGSKDFVYQLNEYFDGEKNKNTGGLRIFRVDEKSNSGTVMFKEYTYVQDGTTNSSGQVSALDVEYSYVNQYFMIGVSPVGTIGGATDYCVRKSTTLTQLADIKGYHVGYSTVQVRQPSTGYEEYSFTNFSESQDGAPIQSAYFISTTGISETVNSDKIKFFPSTSNYSKRGLLLGGSSFLPNGRKIYSFSNSYGFEDIKSIPAIQTVFTEKLFIYSSLSSLNEWFSVGKYFVNSVNVFVNSTTKKRYSYLSSGVCEGVDIETYNYNQEHLLASVTHQISTGDIETKEFRYPLDFMPNIIARSMISNNICNAPIEIVQKKNGLVTSASVNEYTCEQCLTDANGLLTSGFHALKQVSQLETKSSLSDYMNARFDGSKASVSGLGIDSRCKPQQIFDIYDDKGNVLQEHSVSGKESRYKSYIYGYNQTLPIANVGNAKKDQIAYTSFEGVTNEGGWIFTAQDCDKQFANCQSGCSDIVSKLSACMASCPSGNQACASSCQQTYNPPSCYTACNGIYQSCMTYASHLVASGKTGNKALSSPSVSKSGLPAGDYIVSFYAKKGSGGNSISVNSNSITVADDWQYYEVPCTNITSVNITGSAIIDELRLYPTNATMQTFTYSPLVGKTSETDTNGVTTYYLYDSFGRLTDVKDNKGNIIKHTTYNYGSSK